MRPIVALAALLFAVATLTAQGEPKLEITSPLEGEYVSGAVKIEARLVPLAAERDIAKVEFFADGTNVCTLAKRPWTCAWNAGAIGKPRLIRVVMEMNSGRRIVKTMYTRGVDVGESTGVSAVKVTTTVKDGSGRFVPGLRPSDFKVFEADAPQVVTGFAAEQADVTVVLAIDTSGSMSHALPNVRTQAKEFLRLMPAKWPKAVLAFDNSVFVISPPGSSEEERSRNIDLLKAWGGTALYNAVLRALKEVEVGEGRKAVVVFTDGDDRNSTVDVSEVRKAIESSDAVVYFVASGEAARNRVMMKTVEELADISGGRVLRGESDADLDKAFADVREEIRNQYLLTYVPARLAPVGTWRPLSVKALCSGCRVRARRGYTVVTR
jgi:Ca-activated chloride channel family protein